MNALAQRLQDEFTRRRLTYRRDHIPGGLGDTAKASDFDKATLLRGLKVELEHTDDPAVALEIALDHLTEDSRYYEKLATLKLSRMLSREFDRLRYAKFVESEHPRDEDGKFTSGLSERASDMLDDSSHDSQPFSGDVYHGSSNHNLGHISATPEERQFDNGTSQLGAFVTTDKTEAGRYAGEGGKMYSVRLELKNPYEMPFRLFSYLQDPTKDASGNAVPSGKWESRLAELRDEGREIKKRLSSMGHDGVIIKDRSGRILEIASFSDIAFN